MLTRSMTPDEMIKEVTTDMMNILRYLDHRENHYRRAVLKAKKFPVIFAPHWYLSPRKNTWLILLEAPNKQASHSDLSRITMVCLLNHDNGMFCFMPTWVNGKILVLIYLPHFISRYGKRTNQNITGKELIATFFRRNESYAYTSRETTYKGQNAIEVAGSTKDGVALGLSIKGGILFKTFVTYDMLKGEQIEKFTNAEKIRQEIHEKY